MPEDPASTKVLIASDWPLFRSTLAEALETRGMEVVGQAGEEPSAVALAKECKADVFLVDLETGATGLPLAIEEVHEVSPQTEVVVVTRLDNPAQGRAWAHQRADSLSPLRRGGHGEAAPGQRL